MILLATRIATLLSLVGPHEGRPSKAPLDGGLVYDHRILHVPAVVGHHCNDEVLPCRSSVEMKVLHGLRLDQGYLRVVEKVPPGVWSDPVI